jgi:localization factor PodJL
MTSGLPWHVTGVRRQVREAAQEAARRSGMSVGEWLDAVILGCASQEGIEPSWLARPPHDSPGNDGAGVEHVGMARTRAQERSGVEQHLREINSQIDAVKQPCCFNRAVDSLRRDLAEIGLMLREAMPRRAVEALENEVRKLADRIDDTRHTGADGSALAAVEQGLAEMRDALRALTPAEGLLGVARVMQQLAHKVDLIGSNVQNPAALEQLEGAIVAMRGIVSHVASNNALAKLSDEVRALAGKIDQAAGRAGARVVSVLDGRIAMLADALEALNRSRRNVPDELAVAVRGLVEKIEQTQLRHSPLGDRFAELIEKLDASHARLNHLEAIERGLKELLVRLDSAAASNRSRACAPPPELEALSRDLADLRQTEKKTQDSLEVLHGTLGHVVDRLATIEIDLRAKPMQGSDAPPVLQSASLRPAAATTQNPHAAFKEPAPAVPETAAVPETPAPTMSVAAEQGLTEPEPPPDRPLEAGSSAAPRHNSAGVAERATRADGSPPGVGPSAIGDRRGRSNFIAAARRAAQAAPRDALPSKGGFEPSDTFSAASRPVRRVVGRLRALITG